MHQLSALCGIKNSNALWNGFDAIAADHGFAVRASDVEAEKRAQLFARQMLPTKEQGLHIQPGNQAHQAKGPQPAALPRKTNLKSTQAIAVVFRPSVLRPIPKDQF